MCSSETSPSLTDVVTTEKQSLLLVKKLLAIAVSNITYLRGLFPETAYVSRYFGDLKVLILQGRSCPAAQQLVHWLRGSFDALERGYLRMVILSMYCDPDNAQKVTECYQFNIKYTEKGPQMGFNSKTGQSMTKPACDNIQNSSTLLVRKLYMLMQNLGPLPDNVCLNMRLFYYGHVTPQEYQPPGFKEDDSGPLVFESEPVNLIMGDVVTPFHSLRMNITTEQKRLELVNDEDDDVAIVPMVLMCLSTDSLNFEDEVMSECTADYTTCTDAQLGKENRQS